VKGQWEYSGEKQGEVIDPMNGKVMHTFPDVQKAEAQPYIEDLASCPKTGLHNPFKNKERYLMYGEVNRRLVEAM